MTNDSGALTLGDLIRGQRQLAALSIKQVAEVVGISIPYLSQIERGLRAPSEDVLHSIADALDITADALLATRWKSGQTDVLRAIADDPDLTARQRAVLVEIYDSFRTANRVDAGRAPEPGAEASVDLDS